MSEPTKSRPQISQTSIESRSQISPIAVSQFLYCLHHTNHPRLVVITPRLTTNNYMAWCRSFLLALSIKYLTRFINGTIPKLKTADPIYLSWIRCNNLLVAWFLESITQPIALRIFYRIQQ